MCTYICIRIYIYIYIHIYLFIYTLIIFCSGGPGHGRINVQMGNVGACLAVRLRSIDLERWAPDPGAGNSSRALRGRDRPSFWDSRPSFRKVSCWTRDNRQCCWTCQCCHREYDGWLLLSSTCLPSLGLLILLLLPWLLLRPPFIAIDAAAAVAAVAAACCRRRSFIDTQSCKTCVYMYIYIYTHV